MITMTRRTFARGAAAVLAAQSTRGVRRLIAEDTSSDPASMTLAEASARLRTGSITSVQLVQSCLDRIDIYGPKLDCFITVMREQALAQAKILDAERKAGKLRGALHGIPVALKDNIDTAGTRTTAGSGVFQYRVPDEDAPVTARLKAAGAIILGKTNLHEFAMGAGEASFFGPARNPWALDHSTGGSSSGSGAAMSADLCYGALGTDTAGSIRIPSSYCGIVGIKPTYGLVPIRGIAPLAVSLDHCGPMTKCVEDAAIMLNVLAGYDKLDITSVDHPREDYVAGMKQPVAGFRIGVPIGAFDQASSEVEAAVRAAIAVIAGMTKGVKEVSLPAPNDVAYQNFAKFGEVFAYHEQFYKLQSARYQAIDRKRLEDNEANHPRAEDYIRMRWELETLRRTVDDAFTDFDLVVLPTMKTPAPPLDELIRRDLQTIAGTVSSSIPSTASEVGTYNAYGVPSLSIPCGFSKEGLPIGMMICGPHFSESKVFALAHAYEKATQWHTKKPPVTPQTTVPELMTHL
ncbi:amidase [Silvibacterium acidisoli]|uniref:amidase n=1 Tax=Acidobacteriaceae bacterium ZG23-2 TaxID=2883246 RepID=UPI00406C177C